MPGLNLRHLRCFLVLAEELHFSRAAARLKIGQPSLSQQIRRLEDELSVKLFRRTNRRVELTGAGIALQREGELLVAQVERAGQAARRAERGDDGELVLGSMLASYGIMTRILARFRALYPAVRVNLLGLSTSAQLEALGTGRIDAGIVRMPIFEPAIRTRVIAREPLVVAMAADHPLARRRKVTLAELSGEPVILFPRRMAPHYYDMVISLFHREKLRLQIAYEVEQTETILALVGSGYGVSLLAESTREISSAAIVYRTLVGPPIEVETALAYRPNHRSRLVESLIAVVDEVLPVRKSSRSSTAKAHKK